MSLRLRKSEKSMLADSLQRRIMALEEKEELMELLGFGDHLGMPRYREEGEPVFPRFYISIAKDLLEKLNLKGW